MSRIECFAIFLLAAALLGPGSSAASDGYDWTGFYIGGNAGYGWGDSEVEVTSPFVPGGFYAFPESRGINRIGERDADPKGFTGGVQAGFDWQIGSFVLGLETDFEYFKQRDTTTKTLPFPCCSDLFYQFENTVETKWLYTLRPKVGFALDRVLVFVSGGLAVTELEDEFHHRNNVGGGATEAGSIEELKAGWSVGGGLEYGLLDHLSVRLEYLHVAFGRESETESNFRANGVAFPLTRMKHSLDLTSEIARLAVNFRF